MKKVFLLISFFVTLSACTDCDDNTPVSESEIIGGWELIAVLSDTGGGSGTFQPATGKTLQFTAQGVVNCNISFCFGSLTQATTTGTYDVGATFIDVDNCTGTYSFNDGFLEVSHFCVETCGERYVRIN